MRKYLLLSRNTWHTTTVYKFNLFTGIIATLLAIFLTREIWHTIGTGDSSFSTIGIMTYYTLSMILQTIYGPTMIWEMSHKVQSGDISTDFQRPWDYQLAILFSLFGKIMGVALTTLLPVIIIVLFFFPISFPDSLLTWIIFVISVLLGLIINFSIQFFVGLLAFIFIEIWAFDTVFSLAIGLLSGKVLPILFFPRMLQDICNILPFRGIYDIPVKIFLGESSLEISLLLILFQAVWAIILFFSVRLFLKIFQKRLIVAGG